MKTLDAKAAAEEIHQSVNIALANDHPTPEDRHSLSFVQDVCDHLGLEPTPHNCAIVAGELAKHDIAPHTVQEYPKSIGRTALVGADGQPVRDEFGRPTYGDVIVHSEDEEKSWSKESRPVLGSDGKPLLDAAGKERSEEVLSRNDTAAPVVARTSYGPYPKVVGQRRLFGADRKPLRDQLGGDRTQDVIVNNEDEENAYYESLHPTTDKVAEPHTQPAA